MATHIEFVSEVETLTCPVCERRQVREAVLVNSQRLVLAKGMTCVHCGHRRHRTSAHPLVAAKIPA